MMVGVAGGVGLAGWSMGGDPPVDVDFFSRNGFVRLPPPVLSPSELAHFVELFDRDRAAGGQHWVEYYDYQTRCAHHRIAGPALPRWLGG